MEITTYLKRGVPVLAPEGKIVGGEVSALREKLLLWIDDAETPYLFIDFSEVRKIDSSALGMLVNAHTLATRQGTRVGLINVGNHIRNLLVLTRLVNVFRCFRTTEAAISAFAPRSQWIQGVSKAIPASQP